MILLRSHRVSAVTKNISDILDVADQAVLHARPFWWRCPGCQRPHYEPRLNHLEHCPCGVIVFQYNQLASTSPAIDPLDSSYVALKIHSYPGGSITWYKPRS